MKIIAILAVAALLSTARAEEETPLQYLIKSLQVDASGGSVETTTGTLEWPKILTSEPRAVAVGHSHGYDAEITVKWIDDSWVNFLAANGFERDRTLEVLTKESPGLRKFFGRDQVSYSRTIDLPRLGVVSIHAFVANESGEHPKLDLIVGHYTRYFVAPKHGKAEAGADQPASGGDSKAEDKEKAKLEPKERSQ